MDENMQELCNQHNVDIHDLLARIQGATLFPEWGELIITAGEARILQAALEIAAGI